MKQLKVLAASPRENGATQQKQQVENSSRSDGTGGGDDSDVTSCNYCIGVSVYTKYVAHNDELHADGALLLGCALAQCKWVLELTWCCACRVSMCARQSDARPARAAALQGAGTRGRRAARPRRGAQEPSAYVSLPVVLSQHAILK